MVDCKTKKNIHEDDKIGYIAMIKNDRTAPVDASFYYIREYFQGRSEKGMMKQKSSDETYNALIKSLRQNLPNTATRPTTCKWSAGYKRLTFLECAVFHQGFFYPLDSQTDCAFAHTIFRCNAVHCPILPSISR